MDIQVVLIQDDAKLGKRGQVVKVSSGYATNFLFPHNKAKHATPANLKLFEAEKARADKDSAERLAAANQTKEKLEKLSLVLEVLTGEGEKLYGAVTSQDILQALQSKAIAVDKKEIHLAEPIRKLGNYEVTVKPHATISAKLKIAVIKKK